MVTLAFARDRIRLTGVLRAFPSGSGSGSAETSNDETMTKTEPVEMPFGGDARSRSGRSERAQRLQLPGRPLRLIE